MLDGLTPPLFVVQIETDETGKRYKSPNNDPADYIFIMQSAGSFCLTMRVGTVSQLTFYRGAAMRTELCIGNKRSAT